MSSNIPFPFNIKLPHIKFEYVDGHVARDFSEYIKRSNLNKLKEIFLTDKDKILKYCSQLLIMICSYENINIIEWFWNEIVEHKFVSKIDFNDNCYTFDTISFISIFCNGRLDIVKWIWNKHLKYNIPCDFSVYFSFACQSCNLDLIQYVWNVCMDPKDRTITYNIFISVCNNGNIKVFKWLWNKLVECIHDNNYINDIFLRNNQDECFKVACKKHNIEIAKFLWSLIPYYWMRIDYKNQTIPYYTILTDREYHLLKYPINKEILKHRNHIRFRPGNMGAKIAEIHFKLLHSTEVDTDNILLEIFNKYTDVMSYLGIYFPSQISNKINEYLIYD